MFLVKRLLVPPSSKILPIFFQDEEGSKRFETNECCICLDKFNETNKAKMPCGHYFHTDCILNWVDKKKRNMNCPICRQNLKWTIILDSNR